LILESKGCDRFLNDGLDSLLSKCSSINDIEKEKLRKIKKRADNLVHKGDYRQVRNLVSDEKAFECLDSRIKCNTDSPEGIGCCDGQTIQTPR